MVEAVKSAVMVFDIMTDVSFWAGVGTALLAVLQGAVAATMGTLAQYAASFLSMIPGTDDAREFASGLAQEFYNAQRKYLLTSGQSSSGLINQYGGRVADRFVETITKLSTAFERGYDNTPDVWDTTDYRTDIAAASERIVAALDAQNKAAREKEEKSQPRKKTSQEDAVKPYKVMWETVLQGSLARVGGGGYGRMMLSADTVPQKQLSEQKKTNELLNKLLQKEKGSLVF